MKNCVRCGAENSSEYKYCKFCGAELPCVDQKVYRQNDTEYNNDGIEFSTDSEDITIPEIDRFVGKNYEQIVPRFVTMQQKGIKFVWCLPAFLFGLFFGLPGLAIWFLYRKMTKPAAAILALALIFEGVKMAFAFGPLTECYTMLLSGIERYADLLITNPEAAMQWLTDYINEMQILLSSSLSSGVPVIISTVDTYICQLFLPIGISFLGLFLYKKHSLKKISDIKRNSESKAHYVMRLTREGGTSVGRVCVGLAIYLLISFVISSLPLFVSVFGM